MKLSLLVTRLYKQLYNVICGSGGALLTSCFLFDATFMKRKKKYNHDTPPFYEFYLFIWFLSVLLFFFSKKILRYSQYNGIYSVWNETQGGRGKIQPKKNNTKLNKPKNKKEKEIETGSKAVSIDTTVKTINPWCSIWTATAVTEVNPPPTLQTSKVMQTRLGTAFRKTKQQTSMISQSRRVPPREQGVQVNNKPISPRS